MDGFSGSDPNAEATASVDLHPIQVDTVAILVEGEQIGMGDCRGISRFVDLELHEPGLRTREADLQFVALFQGQHAYAVHGYESRGHATATRAGPASALALAGTMSVAATAVVVRAFAATSLLSFVLAVAFGVGIRFSGFRRKATGGTTSDRLERQLLDSVVKALLGAFAGLTPAQSILRIRIGQKFSHLPERRCCGGLWRLGVLTDAASDPVSNPLESLATDFLLLVG